MFNNRNAVIFALGCASLALAGCNGGSADAQACVDQVENVLLAAWVDMGSPAVTDRSVLEDIVDAAKPRFKDIELAHNEDVWSTSIMNEDIVVWARCNGQEATDRWKP